MKKILLANWKANLGREAVGQWCEHFSRAYRPRNEVEVVLAVPTLFLETVGKQTGHLPGVSLAAQGVSGYPQGSYTGATPAAWLRGLARYALIGHRERRRYFHETVQDVARQAYESLAEDLVPIICFDQELLVPQTAAMAAEELASLIWAYTPETPASLEMARSTADIAALLPQIARRTEGRPVLYGGGVTADNASELWRISGISGLLLGQASLDARSFAELASRL